MKSAELEISLRPPTAQGYPVGLRFTRPDDDGEIGTGQAEIFVTFDPSLQDEAEPVLYGQQLSRMLFASQMLRDRFIECRTIAQENALPLRIRLFIEPQTEKLHTLRWETLADPQQPGEILGFSEKVFFSRFLSSADTSPVRLRRPDETRAFIFIANPADLNTYKPGNRQLAGIDVAGELQRAREALDSIPVETLNNTQRASLETLGEILRNVSTENLRAGYSVLYLVCHGALIDGQPWLVLENSEGNTEMVEGSRLIETLKNLRRRPRLIVLASCQSAGTGEALSSDDNGVLSALGPRLAQEAGIPAVLAMQGNVTMKTIAQFMPAFFRELQRDGMIDRALAVARRQVRDRHDWWSPTLFMRLKSGRIWHGTQADSSPGFDDWPTLADSLLDGKCTPILGPGLHDSLVGSRQQIAQKLADKYQYPMADHDRDDLPQVLQYIYTNSGEPDFARREALRGLCTEMIARCNGNLPEALRGKEPSDMTGNELINVFVELQSALWEKQLQANPCEPHRVLAALPFSQYLTTNQDSLMTLALKKAQRAPVVELCRWNEDLAQLPSVFETANERAYAPTHEHPFVYHFYGRVEKPEFLHTDQTDLFQIKSAVLTEDDFFDFLLGFGRRNSGDNNSTNNRLSNYVPNFVRSALVSHKLLFLGFQIDDWNFRVLLRCIRNLQGSNALMRRKKHIAVQLNPQSHDVRDVERARKFLSEYLNMEMSSISVIWGSVEDFTQRLHQQWFSE
jgi:hypothetical protein